MRSVAHSDAHIPTLLEYDRTQRSYFDSPQAVESSFRKHVSEHISRAYVTHLNRLLKDVAVFCMTSRPPCAHMEKWSDVLYVEISLQTNKKGQLNLWLHCILVRPCFQGHGMLTLLVYQMLVCAQQRGNIRKVIVQKCVPTTLAILHRKFGHLPCHQTRHNPPNFVFTHLSTMDLSSTISGLDAKIESRDGVLMTLRASAFPTSKQLNRPEWVEEDFINKL